MRWKDQVTQAKNSPSLQPAPCHPLPGTLKQVIAFCHRFWRNGVICKWRLLQLSAFLSFWQSLSSVTDCATFHEQNAIALEKKSMSVCSSWRGEPQNAPEHHCIIPPWAGVGTVSICWDHGWGQRWAGRRKRKEILDHLHKKMASTGGFINFWCGCCPGWVMSLLSVSIFLYLSVSWLKFLKMTGQWVDKTGILFSISLHPYFVEKVGVLSDSWTFW